MIFPTIIPNKDIELVISNKCPILAIPGNKAFGTKKITPEYKNTKQVHTTNVFLVFTMFINGITKMPKNIPRNNWKG